MPPVRTATPTQERIIASRQTHREAEQSPWTPICRPHLHLPPRSFILLSVSVILLEGSSDQHPFRLQNPSHRPDTAIHLKNANSHEMFPPIG